MRTLIWLQCTLIVVTIVLTQAAEKSAEEEIKVGGSGINTDADFKWHSNKKNDSSEFNFGEDISDEEDGEDIGGSQEDEDILEKDTESDGDDMGGIEEDEAKFEQDGEIDGDDMGDVEEEDDAKLGEDAISYDNEADDKDDNNQVIYEVSPDNSEPCARICPRIYRPLCISINGVNTTVPSVCDLDNRIRCAQGLYTSDGLPWTFEFLHDEPCEE